MHQGLGSRFGLHFPTCEDKSSDALRQHQPTLPCSPGGNREARPLARSAPQIHVASMPAPGEGHRRLVGGPPNRPILGSGPEQPPAAPQP